MLSVTAFLTIVIQASAELKVWLPRDANLDNMTLRVLPSQLAQVVRVPMAPPQHFAQPLSSATPQVVFGRQWMPSWGSHGASTLVRAEEATKEATTEEAKAPSGSLNVFGEKLEGCASDGDICTYTAEAPEVCVRSDKAKFLGTPGNTLSFSCKSVWTAEWKKFRLPGGKINENQAAAAGDTAKCQSVPAEALDSSYSKEEWDSYLNKEKVLPKEATLKTGGFSGNFKEEKVQMKSRKGGKFRRAIDFICATCAVNAESEAAKQTVTNKCKALGWNPENPVSWKDENPEKAELIQAFPSMFSNFALLLIASCIGGALTFMVLRFRRSASGTAKVALLEAVM